MPEAPRNAWSLKSIPNRHRSQPGSIVPKVLGMIFVAFGRFRWPSQLQRHPDAAEDKPLYNEGQAPLRARPADICCNDSPLGRGKTLVQRGPGTAVGQTGGGKPWYNEGRASLRARLAWANAGTTRAGTLSRPDWPGPGLCLYRIYLHIYIYIYRRLGG